MTGLQTQESYKVLAQSFFEKNDKLKAIEPLEKAKFLRLCQVNGLDPFKNEVYAIPYGKTLQIVVNYKVYLERAEKSGQLNGWKTEIYKEEKTITGGKITIYKKGWENPFEYEVDFDEVKQNSQIWKDRPQFMLKKTLIKQGFQMAFPMDLEVDELDDMEVVDGETVDNIAPEKIKELAKIANGDIEPTIVADMTEEQIKIIEELLQEVDFAMTKPTNFTEAENYIIKLKKTFAQGIIKGEYKPDEDYIRRIFADDAQEVLDQLPKK